MAESTEGEARTSFVLSRAFYWFVKRPFFGISTTVVGLAGLAVLIRETDQYPQGELSIRLTILSILDAVIITIGIISLAIWSNSRFVWKPELRRARIEGLVKSLRVAMDTVELIRLEIEESEVLVSTLEAKAAQQGELVQLQQSEVEAVAELLRHELRKEGRKSLLFNIAIGFFFLILGILGTLYFTN